MSKRKRAPRPAGDESNDDASVKEDMVHVTPDLLAGSPDIFAGKKSAATDSPSPALTEPPAESELSAGSDEPAESNATLTGEPEPAVAAEPPAAEPPAAEPVAVEPAAPTPPYVNAVPYPSRGRRFGSSAALGMVLIVVGIFALVVVLAGIDLTQYGWPLFVIIPGLTLLVAGFLSFGQGASIPGGAITVLGLVLAYQNSTGDWASWAYVWALIVPGGVGLGMYLQAMRDRDQHALKTGRTLMFIALMIFAIGFVLFESILGISGRDYGIFGKAALPALLIVIGLILLVRSIQRARRT
ncbi:MAG TPA: hypothetical protein VNA65_04505 [Candidatus Dormibacteraeota bacterium]|nr:hypothetical protein [Candidatus Dormibacteraeota bacterium]